MTGGGADAKVASMEGIHLNDIFEPIWAGKKEILETQRDPKHSSYSEPLHSTASLSNNIPKSYAFSAGYKKGNNPSVEVISSSSNAISTPTITTSPKPASAASSPGPRQ